MMLELYRKEYGGSSGSRLPSKILIAVISSSAHPASVQPVLLAKTARTLTIPTIPKYVFKYLHT
jgi:hypothetical protein